MLFIDNVDSGFKVWIPIEFAGSGYHDTPFLIPLIGNRYDDFGLRSLLSHPSIHAKHHNKSGQRKVPD
jgi:hypothetical protein